jgi:hypothetical protein
MILRAFEGKPISLLSADRGQSALTTVSYEPSYREHWGKVAGDSNVKIVQSTRLERLMLFASNDMPNDFCGRRGLEFGVLEISSHCP